MNSRKINLKIIAIVLTIALMIPFFSTIIDTEAADIRSSLSENMEKFGFSADTNDLTISIQDDVKVYLNAGDANNRTNFAKKYSAGKYYIYKSVDGSLNISKTEGEPGAWVNVRDLHTEDTTSDDSQSNDSSNNESGSNNTSSSSETFVLQKSTKIYYTADEAMNNKNARGTFSKGKYYVYKKHGDAINITTNPSEPGAWINSNAGEVEEVSSKTKPSKPKPSNPKKNPSKPSIKANNSGKVKLNSRTKVYVNASDAENDNNAVGSWGSGTYFVYKTYGKAINITDIEGQPGAWVNEKSVSGSSSKPSKPKAPKASPSKPKKSNKKPSNNLDVNSKVVVNTDFKVYINADDAINERNSNGTWSKGTYYIYKVYENAINLTDNPGTPGGWVSGSITKKSTDTQPSRPEPSRPAPSKPSKPNKKPSTNEKNFVLVFDPGHGEGFEHNRGGLLFNEGDQNYKFTELIRKSAKKYANVVTKTTRPTGKEDPEMEDRARAGNGADLYFSIHSNAAAPSVRGVELWASNDNTKHKFAEEMTRTWSKELDTPNRGVKYDQKRGGYTSKPVKGAKDTWWVFQGNGAKEKYMLESAFHTNITDSKNYLNKQQVLADKFMEIVAKHFNLRLK